MDQHSAGLLRWPWLRSLGKKIKYHKKLSDSDGLNKVMTGSLQLEDLPKLDQMVDNFYEISKDGPKKILRGLINKISV